MRFHLERSARFWLYIVGDAAAMLLAASIWPASMGAQQFLAGADASHLALRYDVSTSVIAAALATEGLTLTPDRLHLAMPLSATSPAPKLRVAGAELGQDGSLRLRILCRGAGECMPFFATVAMDDHGTALATLADLHAKPAATANANANPSASAPVPSLAAAAPRPQGIAVGARITLELSDAQMRIQLPAIAIDTGTPGTEVRVASLDRRHTWRGTVRDANTVQGGVQ